MKKYILLALLMVGYNLMAQIRIGDDLSDIDYGRPSTYEIAGITVEGTKYVDGNVLAMMSGLKAGKEITIPGDDIAQAIPVGYYPTIMLIRPDHTFAMRDIYPPTLEMMEQYMTSEGIEQHECQTGIEENSQAYNLFPNPANESLTLKGTSLGTVKVYNTLGQEVESIDANSNELKINTVGYSNGVYFIKVNESTLRFVVTH